MCYLFGFLLPLPVTVVETSVREINQEARKYIANYLRRNTCKILVITKHYETLQSVLTDNFKVC